MKQITEMTDAEALGEYERLVADGGITNWQRARDIADGQRHRWEQLKVEAHQLVRNRQHQNDNNTETNRQKQWFINMRSNHPERYEAMKDHFNKFWKGRQTNQSTAPHQLDPVDDHVFDFERDYNPRHGTIGDEPLLCPIVNTDGICEAMFNNQTELDEHLLLHHYRGRANPDQLVHIKAIMDNYQKITVNISSTGKYHLCDGGCKSATNKDVREGWLIGNMFFYLKDKYGRGQKHMDHEVFNPCLRCWSARWNPADYCWEGVAW